MELTTTETGTYTTTLFYGGVKVPTTHKTTVTPGTAVPLTPSTPTTNQPPFAPVPKRVLPHPQAPAPAKQGVLTPADVAKVKVQGLDKSKMID